MINSRMTNIDNFCKKKYKLPLQVLKLAISLYIYVYSFC